MPHKEKDANRAYMREYMRRRRAAVRPGVKPDAVKSDVKPDSAEIARLTAELAQAKARIVELEAEPTTRVSKNDQKEILALLKKLDVKAMKEDGIKPTGAFIQIRRGSATYYANMLSRKLYELGITRGA